MSYYKSEIDKIFSKDDLVYENVNINNFKIFLDGDIKIELINSYNGKFLKNIVCSNVIFFSFEPEKNNEKNCAIFALGLYNKKLVQPELKSVLLHFDINRNVEKHENYNFLNIFSSEMNINIICKYINFESNTPI